MKQSRRLDSPKQTQNNRFFSSRSRCARQIPIFLPTDNFERITLETTKEANTSEANVTNASKPVFSYTCYIICEHSFCWLHLFSVARCQTSNTNKRQICSIYLNILNISYPLHTTTIVQPAFQSLLSD